MISRLFARNENGGGADSELIEKKLSEDLAEVNIKRAVIFSAVSLLTGLVSLLFPTAAGENEGLKFLRVLGSLLMMLISAAIMWLGSRSVQRRKPDYTLMKTLSFIYWTGFTLCSLTICAAELFDGGKPYILAVFAAAVTAVPAVGFKTSLLFAAAGTAAGIACGICGEHGILYYIALAAVILAYIWLASCVRASCALSLLSEERISVYENRYQNARLTDSLTGMLNKAGLAEHFGRMLESDEQTKTITVVLIDVDNFRRFNHEYGYAKSDECLSAICKYINIAAKPYTDLISRFGGDDFVIIFKDMDERETVKLSEQLRQNIERMAKGYGDKAVTVSIGISSSKKLLGKLTYSELLNEADDMLMIAKASGKNCIGFKGRAFINEGRINV